MNRWQDYGEHSGGVVGHYVTTDKMAFSGGFHFPESGYKETWAFTASRLTGAAELVREGKPPVSYMCSKVGHRF